MNHATTAATRRKPPERSATPALTISGFDALESGAFFDVTVGKHPTAFTIRRFRLSLPPGRAPLLHPPALRWRDAAGQRRYKPLVAVPADWQKAILTAALREWEALGKEGGLSDAARN